MSRSPRRAAPASKPKARRGRPPKAAVPGSTPNGSGLPDQAAAPATATSALQAQLTRIKTDAAAGKRLPHHEARILRDAWLLEQSLHLWPGAEAAAADLGISVNTLRGYAAARPDGTPGCPGIEAHSPIPKAPVLAWLLKHTATRGGTSLPTQESIEAVELSIKQAKEAKLWGTLVAEAEDRAQQGLIEVLDALRHQLLHQLPAQLADQARTAADRAAAEDAARELIETALRGIRYQPPASVTTQPSEGTPA